MTNCTAQLETLFGFGRQPYRTGADAKVSQSRAELARFKQMRHARRDAESRDTRNRSIVMRVRFNLVLFQKGQFLFCTAVILLKSRTSAKDLKLVRKTNLRSPELTKIFGLK